CGNRSPARIHNSVAEKLRGAHVWSAADGRYFWAFRSDGPGPRGLLCLWTGFERFVRVVRGEWRVLPGARGAMVSLLNGLHSPCRRANDLGVARCQRTDRES